MNVSSGTRIRPAPTTKASISSDGLVLLDVNGGVVLASNLVGARIWQHIEQGDTTQEIAQLLVAEYGISDARAQADVAAFIDALLVRRLVAAEATP